MIVGFSCSEARDKMWSEKRAENDPVTFNLVFESVKESTKSDENVTSLCITNTLKGKQVMRIKKKKFHHLGDTVLMYAYNEIPKTGIKTNV